MRRISIICLTWASTLLIVAATINHNDVDIRTQKNPGVKPSVQHRPLPQLGPDIAQDVLVRAGKHLQKQQLEAQKNMKSAVASQEKEERHLRELERSHAMFLRSFERENSIKSPRYGRSTKSIHQLRDFDATIMRSRKEGHATAMATKYSEATNQARRRVRDRGKDIENIGMMNQFLHKKMKEQFPPVENPNAHIKKEKLRMQEMSKSLGGLKGAFTRASTRPSANRGSAIERAKSPDSPKSAYSSTSS